MIRLLRIFFKDRRLNLIYLSLLMIVFIVTFLIIIINEYFYYNINYVVGSLKENRTYIVYTEEDVINLIEDDFNLEDVYLEDGAYIVVLKYFSDTSTFEDYLANNQIDGVLQDSTKLNEINVLKKNSYIFNILKYIILIVIFFISYFIFKNLIYNESNNILVLRVVGYSRGLISLLLFSRIIILLIISFIIMVLLTILSSFIIPFLSNINYLIINLEVFSYIFMALLFSFFPFIKKIKEIAV